MTSRILKSVDFTKTQKPRYLENETLFFLQIKKFINYITGYFIAKNSFVAEVTFNLFKKWSMILYSKLKDDPELLEHYNEIFIMHKELGMIKEVTASSNPGKYLYLPHHPVIQEDKEPT